MKKLLAIFILTAFFQFPCIAETVVYNTNTGKYHKLSCPSAAKCTKNCIKTEKSKAKARGGIPCKRCGG